MRLTEFDSLDIFSDADLTGVSIDSRTTSPGDLYIAMPGEKVNGHDFVDMAVSNGASAVAVSRPEVFDKLASDGIPVIRIGDPIEFCWQASTFIYNHPTRNLQMVGITGTNGKTTTAWILAQMLNLCGQNCAYVGTLGAQYAGEKLETGFTTPFPPDLNKLFVELKKRGADSIAMEVSSHALAQRRVDGVEFDVALFTNLSQDHLDFHGNLENYFEAKRRLFGDLPSTKPLRSAINADDSWGIQLLKSAPGAIGYGKNAQELKLIDSGFSASSLQMELEWEGKNYLATAQLGARFNVYNSLAAISASLLLGIPIEKCISALSKAKAAPGRFEAVETNGEFSVIVDYAHTPDALQKLLESVRELKPARILTVFGCGGDRDKTKRPLMGSAVSKVADISFVTSDNPRTENPESIIDDILPGMENGKEIRVIVDRQEAIFAAVSEAKNGDVVVIAGKGHEDYQIIGTTKRHFDDREIASEAIEAKA